MKKLFQKNFVSARAVSPLPHRERNLWNEHSGHQSIFRFVGANSDDG
jgi:hypothetical protein